MNVLKLVLAGFGACIFSLTLNAARANAWDGIAILGDSISTGAASHPALEFDPAVLWRVMSGELSVEAKLSDIPVARDFHISDKLTAPKRLWPSQRENDGASGWIWLHAVQAISRTALDTEEYSYGYLAGRSLGLSSENIWIAGDNGTRTDHAVLHAARVIESADGELPTRILMLYTGNDLCAQSLDAMTSPEDYGEGLRDALDYFVRNGHSAANEKTTVYLPAFLPVTALLLEPTIAEKKIRFHGGELTCAEARKRLFTAPDAVISEKSVLPKDPRYPLFAQFMPPNPALLCPTLFTPLTGDEHRQSLLANRIRSYRDIQKQVVTAFNDQRKHAPSGPQIEARYLDETESIHFVGEDVGGDCFHLSVQGQAKLAATLLRQM